MQSVLSKTLDTFPRGGSPFAIAVLQSIIWMNTVSASRVVVVSVVSGFHCPRGCVSVRVCVSSREVETDACFPTISNIG